jgi:zinc transporter, ZIP family
MALCSRDRPDSRHLENRCRATPGRGFESLPLRPHVGARHDPRAWRLALRGRMWCDRADGTPDHHGPRVTAALGWGALAASSLVIGALLGLVRPWPPRPLGLVLAFGAGALISAVSFDLAEEGAKVANGYGALGLGLAIGAFTYFALSRVVARRSRRGGDGDADEAAGSALALGAFLDGIPEQAVLGISIASGAGVSVGLLVAIFVSNLPEAIGSATEMRVAGTSVRAIRRLWILVAVICTAATVAGYGIADHVSGDLNAAVDGFAAGALLVMLIDSMIPEAVRKGGDVSGLATVLGFAVAAALSSVS